MAAVALAVLALGVYLVSRPSAQEVNAATEAVCDSFTQATKGVQRIQARKPADNPGARQRHAGDLRQAYGLASNYLTTTLDMNPATPDELTRQIRKLAYSYQLRAINSLSGVSGDGLKPAQRMSSDAGKAVKESCAQ